MHALSESNGDELDYCWCFLLLTSNLLSSESYTMHLLVGICVIPAYATAPMYKRSKLNCEVRQDLRRDTAFLTEIGAQSKSRTVPVVWH